MPKTAKPITRPMFTCFPGAGDWLGVDVGAGVSMMGAVEVGVGVISGPGVCDGSVVGVGIFVAEAVRFNTRLVPVSQVPFSTAS